MYYYHRTLEDYITAFRDNGFVLKSLYDVRSCARFPAGEIGQQAVRRNFPFFMVLEFLRV